MEPSREIKAFSVIKRLQSTRHAFRGIRVFFKTQHNAWVHFFSTVLIIALGCVLHISSVEWMLVVISIGMVFMFEAINTAIEFDIDLTSPEYHPFARDTKDVAAGAVMLAGITASIISAIVFIPKLVALMR